MSLRVVSDGGGVLERRFEASSPGGGRVPGLVWSPNKRTPTAAPTATVLIGHGWTSHKRNPYILSLAHRFAACGWHSVAIDAPGHGERRAPDAEPEWPQPDVDETIRDWHEALGLLREEAGLDDTRLAYWGMSMGTSLGISLVAGNPRFQAAALGLMHPNWPAPPGTRIRSDAQRLECPVLFLVNWDDTRAPREAAFELFDLIGSEDKRLHAYPGEHGQLPEEARAASEEFFARHLSERLEVHAARALIPGDEPERPEPAVRKGAEARLEWVAGSGVAEGQNRAWPGVRSRAQPCERSINGRITAAA